ncbi:MAG: LysR family transcriptional regulator [Steroidobacteraceae bacterium]
MRLRYIEMFQAMLQAESVTGAARLLNISQPAATKLLQQAERQLGYPLFIRVMGRVRLTREGEVLRPKIERIADELAELQQLALNLKPSDSEMLRVVSTPTLANTLIPNVVTRMRKTFRKVEINLFTQHTREMLNSLLLHECDVGLTLQQIEHPRIRCQLLSEGQIMAIAPAGHWSTSDLLQPLPLSSLAGAKIVGLTLQDDLGRKINARLRTLSPPVKVSTWVQTYQVARSLVASGQGVAMVDPFTAGAPTETSIQSRVLEPQIPVSLYAVHRIDSPLTTLQSAFLENVRDVAGQILSAET